MKRTCTILLVAAMLAPAAQAEPRFKGWTGPKPPKPPCECRHSGGKAVLGETICRRRGDRLVKLRCELVLNNTAWKETGDGCDTASLPRSPMKGAPPRL